MSHGLIVSWQMKVWQILSIHQIHQTLATPNFCRLRYQVVPKMSILKESIYYVIGQAHRIGLVVVSGGM